jgi:hypothetical protein
MASPLANRFVHLDMEVSVEDWQNWAKSNSIHQTIIAFISYRPDALFAFNTKDDSKAFATPRTWQYVNEILESDPEDDLLFDMIKGSIGEELAAAFLGFKSVAKNLPDIDKILAGEINEAPSETSTLHILSTALSMRINEDTRASELDNLLRYTLNLPGEFAVMIVQDLRDRNIELDYIQSWPLWAKNFNKLLH